MTPRDGRPADSGDDPPTDAEGDPTVGSDGGAPTDGADGPPLRGTTPAAVRRALSAGDPLPGTAGFAGRVDGRLVRDVLGRRPLFLEGGSLDAEGGPAGPGGPEGRSVDAPDRDRGDGGSDGDGSPRAWSFDPAALDSPELLPAGHAVALDGRGLVAGDPRRVWTLPDPEPLADRRAAVTALGEALAAVPVPECPVAFSGGVDSALVAALVASGGESGDASPLYVAGFPDSHDLEAAREAARAMGRLEDLRVVELAHDRIREAAAAVARATGRTNAMDVAIAVPLHVVAKRATADGYERLAVGQGADELFGGYEKVARAPDDPRVEADTVRGARREVLETLGDGLARDVPALRAAGVEPVAPLLHDRVVAAALSLPGDLLVDDGERKVALRLAAREYVPDSVAAREKKAVQYGSLVARELDRLARRAGFKRRMDDHVSKYVASLVE